MSVQGDLATALQGLVAGRMKPVVLPDAADYFDAGPAIVYQIDDSKIDGEGVSMCDSLGLVPHLIAIGLVGRDYEALWTLRDAVLPIVAALPGFSIEMAGRDGPYSDQHKCFLVEITVLARRAIA